MKEFNQYSPEASQEINWEKLAKWARVFLTTVAVATLAFSPVKDVEAAKLIPKEKIISSYTQEKVADEATPENTNPTNPSEIVPDIFYGELARPEQAAFAVTIDANDRNCSGTILSERVIATAFHCVHNEQSEQFEAKDVYVFLAGENQQAFRVKEIRHVSSRAAGNDKVLLLLARPIKFNDKVQPISVGKEEMMYTEVLYAIGSGRNEVGGKYPRVGKQVFYYQNMYENNSCALPKVISTKNVDESNKAVINHGDSGGGLFVEIPEGHALYKPGFYLLGITSQFCSTPEYDENGLPDPSYESGFESLFFDNVDEKIEAIIAETNLWPAPPEYFLPTIHKNASVAPQYFLPSIRKKTELIPKSGG